MTNKIVGITPGAFVESFAKICSILDTDPILLDKKEHVKACDLILFTGGADINPKIYNQENIASQISEHSKKRDIFEIEVLEIAKSLAKKVLAVCRGHQLVNAALGGTLVQEIGWMEPHKGHHGLVEAKGIVGKHFEWVNSMHHQGVLLPGIGQEVTSKHGGIVESTESENIITVQFHPETMNERSSRDFFMEILHKWN